MNRLQGDTAARWSLQQRFWGVVCALAAVLVLLFVLKKSHGWAKGFQAARLAEMAAHYADQGQIQEAMMSADTALRLEPNQPQALRFMAELLEADGRNNQAVELYGRLNQSGRGTLEDLKKQAVNAVRAGYLENANHLAEKLAEKGERDFPTVVQAEIKLHQGEHRAALEILRQAISTRGGRSSRLAYLRLLLATPDVENRNLEIGQQLTSLKEGSDEASLEALTWGVSTNVLAPETRLDWIPTLRQHPKADFPALLLASRVEVELDPTSKDRVAGELAQRVSGRPLKDRLPSAQFLTSIGKLQEASGLLPLKDAISQAAAMRAWVDLAAAKGEWKTLRETLALPQNPLPAHLSKIYSARAAKMSGQQAEGEAQFRAAIEAYKDRPQEMFEVLEYLHRSGEYALFDSAVPYQLANPDQALSTMRRLVPVVADTRDSIRLRRLFQMAEASPPIQSNPFILNDSAYLDLVLQRGTDITVLEKRFQANPSDSAVRFTLALAKLLYGDPKGALLLVKESPIPPQNLATHQLVILAAVLATNNAPENAIRVARLIPAARISNQELDLLQSRLLKPAPR